MDQESISRFFAYLAARFDRYRSGILRTGKFVGKWVAAAAVVSATVSFVLDGTEFFTKKLPSAAAFASKSIFLRKTFRPVLIERVVRKDPAYANLCLEESQVLDLDDDGDATDLLLTFFPRGEQSTCPERNETPDVIYVVLKETSWRGFWPKYAVVRTISRSDIGNFSLGSGYAMTFEQLGPFLFGSIYGTDFPGYAVYGYANGTLQSLGSYRPVGGLIANPQSEPRAQIGNKLVLYAEEGMKSFELRPDGRFVTRSLSAYDIVELDNMALVIEDSDKMPSHPSDKATGSKIYGAVTSEGGWKPYELLQASANDCDHIVFTNGLQAEFQPVGGQSKSCGADLTVSPGTVIIANVACTYTGFLPSTHFPWGRVYDPQQPEHTIKCPADGDDDDANFAYMFTAKLK